ncbi:MAG: DUF2726 domain-containing protein [Gammaproteobacteria bacterium]
MEWLVVLGILVIVLFGITLWLKSRAPGSDDYPYIKREVLFTGAERSLLGVLDQAVGADYRIFGKVRVADVVSVRPMKNRSAWQRAFNRINAKHFDFIFCTKDNLSIVGAVELNDRSHQNSKRQDRDRFLQEVCKIISLPLVQIQARSAYSVTELRDQVLGAVRMENNIKKAARGGHIIAEIEPQSDLSKRNRDPGWTL